MRKCAILFVLFASASTALFAQSYYQSSSGFFDKWQARASATQALQPKWMVPVVSPYPMLIQVFRSDFTRQISPTHVTTWNLGTSRGLKFRAQLVASHARSALYHHSALHSSIRDASVLLRKFVEQIVAGSRRLLVRAPRRRKGWH